MAMRLFNGSGPSPINVNGSLLGDGTSSSVDVDLSVAPHTMVFNGNFPVDINFFSTQVVVNGQVDSSFSATASFKRSILTITFNKPLPVGSLSNNTGYANYTGNLVFESA